MGGFGLLAGFLKAVWPFLREWFFKSRTLRSWLRRSLMSITWMIITIVMFYVSLQLFNSATDAHRRLQDANAKVTKLQLQYNALERSSKRARSQNTTLKEQVHDLTVMNQAQEVVIARYEQWLSACGIDYKAEIQKPAGSSPIPKCKNAQTAPAVSNSRPRNKPTPRPSGNNQQPQHRDLIETVKGIWSNPNSHH